MLVGSTVGGYGAGSVFESMLSVALTLRGARVHTLLCDRALPGCQRAEYVDVPDPSVLVEYRLQERLCDRCYATGQYHFDPLGLTDHRIGAARHPRREAGGAPDRRRDPGREDPDLHLGRAWRSATTPTPGRCATSRAAT